MGDAVANASRGVAVIGKVLTGAGVIGLQALKLIPTARKTIVPIFNFIFISYSKINTNSIKNIANA
jgi:hypothetical protein